MPHSKMGAGSKKPMRPTPGSKGPNDRGGGTGHRPASLPRKNKGGSQSC